MGTQAASPTKKGAKGAAVGQKEMSKTGSKVSLKSEDSKNKHGKKGGKSDLEVDEVEENIELNMSLNDFYEDDDFNNDDASLRLQEQTMMDLEMN